MVGWLTEVKFKILSLIKIINLNAIYIPLSSAMVLKLNAILMPFQVNTIASLL